jgi:aspartate/methionine/tyrosine aminotransferase
LGEPTLPPDIAHFETATRWVAEHGCRYSTNIGFEDVREAIARHYAYPGLDHADNVCMMAGSQEAVYVAMKTLLDPARDEVLLVEPAFPVYAKIALVEGVALRRVEMKPETGFAFDADAILEAIGPATRMIVICSPCNPTGRVMSAACARKIADALLGRAGPPIYVMHDEIYRELTYAADPAAFGSVYPHTLAINSLSKSNSLTGLRMGWVIAPANVMPEIVKMHGWTTSCASTFAQRIAYEIFAGDQLRVNSPWYAAQCEKALDVARESGLEFVEPEGAFYLCVRVGDPETLAFAEALIEEKDVVAIPTHIFARGLTGWLRTSFVGPLDELREGLGRIAALATERGLLGPRRSDPDGLNVDEFAKAKMG